MVRGCLFDFDLLYNNCMLSTHNIHFVHIRIASVRRFNRLNEAILMNTHNTYFHYKIGNIPKMFLNICFLELSEEFPRDSNPSSNSVTSHRFSSN